MLRTASGREIAEASRAVLAAVERHEF